MMSMSKKQEAESDSDWDSLPGDIPNGGSTPEPAKSPSSQVPTHSPVPAPPKQPYSRHPTPAKPINMALYKNTSKRVQKAGNATTFEDKTGGISLLNDDNPNDGIHDSFSMESNNNFMKNKNDAVKENKDTTKKRNVQVEQRKNKKPPFTDFQEALSIPIPAAPNSKQQHKLSGVNQAYSIETADELNLNQDSWDDSENESQMQQSHKTTINNRTTQQELPMGKSLDANHKPQHHSPRMDGNEASIFEMSYGNHYCNTNQNFENCCLIQVTDGAFDDRYRPSFFHGSKNHFHIRAQDPKAAITGIADKSEVALQKFWREVFGVLQILINFFLIFILELFKTVIYSIRYLLTGVLYTTGDHFIKPLLSAMFNNIVQPFAVLLLNVFTICTNLLKPILALTREIFTQIAIPLRAFRLFSFNWEKTSKDEIITRDIKVV